MTEGRGTQISAELREAVDRALAEQEAFENRRASVLGRGTERLTSPIAGLLGRLIPSSVVVAALDRADRATGMRMPWEVTGHSFDDLAACEAAALRVQGWATGTHAATGAVGGLFGAAGLAADIPATLVVSAHTVRATGAAFGFPGDGEEERQFRLRVLSLATSLAGSRRKTAMAEVQDWAGYLATPEGRQALDTAVDWAMDKVVDRIARQLGVSLGSRKAGQIVPLVGGVVGAVVNASFQTDVARSARYAYRQRWLMQRRLLPAPQVEAGDDA